MAQLIDHLESYLGEMSGGSSGDETTPPGVQVAWFPNTPFAGTTTLVTAGLSNHHLTQGGRGPHQELLTHVPAKHAPTAAGVLFQVAGMVPGRGHGLPKGWPALEAAFIVESPDLTDPRRREVRF